MAPLCAALCVGPTLIPRFLLGVSGILSAASVSLNLPTSTVLLSLPSCKGLLRPCVGRSERGLKSSSSVSMQLVPAYDDVHLPPWHRHGPECRYVCICTCVPTYTREQPNMHTHVSTQKHQLTYICEDTSTNVCVRPCIQHMSNTTQHTGESMYPNTVSHVSTQKFSTHSPVMIPWLPP